MAVKAIIVGSSTYNSRQIPNLPAVAADLKRVNDLFKSVNIEVIDELRDPGRTKLLTALRGACQRANREQDLIIYFSGHGHAYRGLDFLVPADAIIEDFEIIKEVLVPVDLDGALKKSRAASLTMIIDACREGIELRTKSVDFSSWSYQRIERKTANISFVFSCGHGEYSRVISDERGSLFTQSFCDAISDRDYAEGTVENVATAAQRYLDTNSERFEKPRQTIWTDLGRKLRGTAPCLFPSGKKVLAHWEKNGLTGWHRPAISSGHNTREFTMLGRRATEAKVYQLS